MGTVQNVASGAISIGDLSQLRAGEHVLFEQRSGGVGMLLSILAALALSPSAATAQDLAGLLGPGSPTCVLMPTVEKASVAPLTPDQFNFARGAFIAIPPGDRAAVVEAGGSAFVALITGEGRAAETCARFDAPPSFLKMLLDIAAGASPQAGRPL